MQTVAARLPDEQVDEVEQYADEHGIGKSEAIRRLTEQGLEIEDHDPHAVSLPIYLVWMGTLAVGIGWFEAAPAFEIGVLGALLIAIGISLTRRSVIDRLTATRRRFTRVNPSRTND